MEESCQTGGLFDVLVEETPVETSVLDRLQEMLLADSVGLVEIGDRPGNLENAVVGPGG